MNIFEALLESFGPRSAGLLRAVLLNFAGSLSSKSLVTSRDINLLQARRKMLKQQLNAKTSRYMPCYNLLRYT